MDTEDLKNLAETALKETRHISYFATSDDAIGNTHILMFVEHRDSNILEQSNFATIKEDLTRRFNSLSTGADYDDVDVYVHSSSHWAFGWIAQLAIRAVDGCGMPTNAFAAAIEWKEALEEYPIADEEDYSRREWEDLKETLTNCYDIPAGQMTSWFATELFDSYSVANGEDVSDKFVQEIWKMVWANDRKKHPVREHSVNYFCHTHGDWCDIEIPEAS